MRSRCDIVKIQKLYDVWCINRMKKLIPFFAVAVLVISALCLILFRIPSYDLNKLTENFNACYNDLEAVANDNNLKNSFFPIDKDLPLRYYTIKLNNKSQITVQFTTSATESKKGNGTFSVSYTISDISDDNNFDKELFTEIVNSVSGKEVSVDFVTEFLASPEEESSNGYAKEKIKPLNFFEDWVIGYNETYDNHAELWLYGYIK